MPLDYKGLWRDTDPLWGKDNIFFKPGGFNPFKNVLVAVRGACSDGLFTKLGCYKFFMMLLLFGYANIFVGLSTSTEVPTYSFTLKIGMILFLSLYKESFFKFNGVFWGINFSPENVVINDFCLYVEFVKEFFLVFWVSLIVLIFWLLYSTNMDIA